MSAEGDPRYELIRTAFDAFNAGDPGVLSLFDPAAEMRVHPPLMNVGEWRGPHGFVAMVAAWHDVFSDIHYELLDVELLDERDGIASVHQAATGKESGVPVELDVFYRFRFEDRKVTRFDVYDSRSAALEAL